MESLPLSKTEKFINGDYEYGEGVYGYGFCIGGWDRWTFQEWQETYTVRRDLLCKGIEEFGEPEIFNFDCDQ